MSLFVLALLCIFESLNEESRHYFLAFLAICALIGMLILVVLYRVLLK